MKFALSRSISKASAILTVITVYVVVFGSLHLLHFRWFTVRVVLYDAVLDAILAGLVVGLIFTVLIRRRSIITSAETILSMMVGFLFSVIYAIVVPTVVDRSLSIYILEKLVQRGGSIQQDAFDELLKLEYFSEHRLIEIRLTEALNSGTIIIENGCVKITRLGQQIAAFTRYYRTTFLPKHREIMGKYSDDLTDPFRNSKVSVPYLCKSQTPP
jgi:hypothetical protein